jgi:RimJ/RimL family protein N-acetyltransferase
MYNIYLEGGRVYLRPVDIDDQFVVVKWRNTKSARDAFFNKDVVTPDTHADFIANRSKHDSVWIAEMYRANMAHERAKVGMTSVRVHNPAEYIGEYGRTYVDEEYRGQGYAKEIEYLMLWAAFEWMKLDSLWLEAYLDNEPVIKLHYDTGWMIDYVFKYFKYSDGRDVARMFYKREWWKTNRLVYADKFGVVLPEWVE